MATYSVLQPRLSRPWLPSNTDTYNQSEVAMWGVPVSNLNISLLRDDELPCHSQNIHCSQADAFYENLCSYLPLNPRRILARSFLQTFRSHYAVFLCPACPQQCGSVFVPDGRV